MCARVGASRQDGGLVRVRPDDLGNAMPGGRQGEDPDPAVQVQDILGLQRLQRVVATNAQTSAAQILETITDAVESLTGIWNNRMI